MCRSLCICEHETCSTSTTQSTSGSKRSDAGNSVHRQLFVVLVLLAGSASPSRTRIWKHFAHGWIIEWGPSGEENETKDALPALLDVGRGQ